MALSGGPESGGPVGAGPVPSRGFLASMPRLTWGTTWALLAFAALLVRAPALAPAVYGLGAVWFGVSRLVAGVARGIAVRQEVSATHVTPGEPVVVRLALRNRTRLPVPWIWVEEPLPVHLESAGHFRACAGIAGSGRCEATFTLRPSRRGRYRIGTIRFRLGDWFGLCTAEGRADLPLWVTVYPPILPLPGLAPEARVPEGPRQDAGSPFHEEITVGLRRYTPGDAQRWIAWKASARHGELLVREFPRVRERATTVVFDLESRSWSAAGGAQALERAFSVAASFFWAPPGGEQATGLYTHARAVHYVSEGTGEVREPPRWMRIAPRRGLPHRRQVLEALAVLRAADGPALEDVLLRLQPLLSPGESALILTCGHRAQAWSAASHLAARHHPVTILAFGTQSLPPCPGVRVLPVSPEGEVRWA